MDAHMDKSADKSLKTLPVEILHIIVKHATTHDTRDALALALTSSYFRACLLPMALQAMNFRSLEPLRRFLTATRNGEHSQTNLVRRICLIENRATVFKSIPTLPDTLQHAYMELFIGHFNWLEERTGWDKITHLYINCASNRHWYETLLSDILPSLECLTHLAFWADAQRHQDYLPDIRKIWQDGAPTTLQRMTILLASVVELQRTRLYRELRMLKDPRIALIRSSLDLPPNGDIDRVYAERVQLGADFWKRGFPVYP